MQLNLFTAKHKSKHIQIKGKLNESQIKTGKLTGKSENRKDKLRGQTESRKGKLTGQTEICKGNLRGQSESQNGKQEKARHKLSSFLCTLFNTASFAIPRIPLCRGIEPRAVVTLALAVAFYSTVYGKIGMKKIHFYRNPIYGKPILTFSNPFLPWPIFEHVCSVILTFESISLYGLQKGFS